MERLQRPETLHHVAKLSRILPNVDLILQPAGFQLADRRQGALDRFADFGKVANEPVELGEFSPQGGISVDPLDPLPNRGSYGQVVEATAAP